MSVHEQIAKHDSKINELYQMIGDLQKWQSTTVENWMRRVESILDTQAEGFNKWQCPNCKEPFADLADFLEHIICNVNDVEARLNKAISGETWNQKLKEDTLALLDGLVTERIQAVENRTIPLPALFNNVTHALEMLENLANRVGKIELFIQEQQAKSNEVRQVIKGLAEGLQEAKVSEHVRPEIVSEFLEKSISILEPEKPASTTPPYPTETGEPSAEDHEDD